MTVDFSWARDLSDEAWCAFLAGTLDISGKTPPALPPDDFQRLFVGRAGIEGLTEARFFLNHLKDTLQQVRTPLHEDMRVLDFGAGWGRLYRILMRDIPPSHLVGADPEPSCIDICQAAMPFGTFIQIPPRPPYPFADHEFDLVYLYSVFTHLNRQIVEDVLEEFARILKPGGHVSFTTLQSTHIDFWEAHSSNPLYKDALEKVGFAASAWRDRLANGEFLFVPTGGATAVETPDVYGWALIGRACLERLLRRTPFEIVAMSEPSDMLQGFAMIRRKQN